jgi:hypothetical protein
MSAISTIGAPLRAHPTRHFWTFIAKKTICSHSTLGRPLRHACVALAWPLGGPRATQTQSQTQFGRGSQSESTMLRRVRCWFFLAKS